MKLIFLSIALLMIIPSCNSQPSAYEKAKAVKKAIDDAPRPGTMPTTAGGWTMTAKVNGTAWTAGSIMPPAAAGRIIGYFKKNSYIGLPAFEKRYVKVGKKYDLDEKADIYVEGDGELYKYTGSSEVTNINGDWVEGRFYFTATSQSTSKKIVVTEGFFRVQL